MVLDIFPDATFAQSQIMVLVLAIGTNTAIFSVVDAVVAVLLLAVTAEASMAPALRAARIDPIVALRADPIYTTARAVQDFEACEEIAVHTTKGAAPFLS